MSTDRKCPRDVLRSENLMELRRRIRKAWKFALLASRINENARAEQVITTRIAGQLDRVLDVLENLYDASGLEDRAVQLDLRVESGLFVSYWREQTGGEPRSAWVDVYLGDRSHCKAIVALNYPLVETLADTAAAFNHEAVDQARRLHEIGGGA